MSEPERTSCDVRAAHLANIGLWGVLTVFAVAVIGLAVALFNDVWRGWLGFHIPLLVIGYGLAGTAVVVAFLAWWSRNRGTAARAAALMLIGFPLVLVACGSLLFLLSPVWKVNTLRTVVNLILFTTPAVMWWLFLAVQRASLLNEFIAHLQRLGLLELRHSLSETGQARTTRIEGYLQKFEGTYGRVPQTVHDELIGQRFGPYSREEAAAQPPVSISVVPVVISVVTLAIGWLTVLPPVDANDFDGQSAYSLAFDAYASPETFAFLGAYFFSLQMLFRRYVRSDLRGSAYVAVVMRIILALIAIWVLQGISAVVGWHLTDSHALLLGFVVGVFPVVVWQVIRSVMAKVFKSVLPSLESQLSLDGLDGLTVWHEARLEEEDIENIPNMATADIVGLLVSTRLPADRIVDWVDQAILLTYLGPHQADGPHGEGSRERLGRHGIRTASALLSAARSATTHGEFDSFAALVRDDSGNSVIPSLLSSIRTSSNLAPVLEWRGMTDDEIVLSHNGTRNGAQVSHANSSSRLLAP